MAMFLIVVSFFLSNASKQLSDSMFQEKASSIIVLLQFFCNSIEGWKKSGDEERMVKTWTITFVTLGWSSLCQTATSCVKAALREAISASDLWPSSPQSRSLTENDEINVEFDSK